MHEDTYELWRSALGLSSTNKALHRSFETIVVATALHRSYAVSQGSLPCVKSDKRRAAPEPRVIDKDVASGDGGGNGGHPNWPRLS